MNSMSSVPPVEFADGAIGLMRWIFGLLGSSITIPVKENGSRTSLAGRKRISFRIVVPDGFDRVIVTPCKSRSGPMVCHLSLVGHALLAIPFALSSAHAASADATSGQYFVRNGNGPQTRILVSSPHTSTMIVDGASSAFPVTFEITDEKLAFHIKEDMFFIINPLDGRAFLSRLNGGHPDLPYLCHH